MAARLVESGLRMQLHLRLGEAMETLLPIDPNPCLGELAYHFCQGAPIGDAGRAIRYSIDARDRATEVGAFEEAAELYQRGLDVLNEFSPADIERLTELRSKLDLATELIKASRPVQPTAVSSLTPRELEMLSLIAQHLHLAEKTVKTHVSSVPGKLGVADRTQAAVLAVRQSLDRRPQRPDDGHAVSRRHLRNGTWRRRGRPLQTHGIRLRRPARRIWRRWRRWQRSTASKWSAVRLPTKEDESWRKSARAVSALTRHIDKVVGVAA